VNRLKKGPDLKMPPVLVDLFYDLHDRRLLPFVALIVVAIVAVPFLLATSSSRSPSLPAPAVISKVGGTDARASRFTVTEVDPGLRVARKRLAKRHAKDPFIQKYTNVVSPEAASQESATTSTTATETPTASTPTSGFPAPAAPVGSSPPAPAPAGPPSSGGNGGGAGTGTGVVTYTWAIDVKITKTETKPDGSKEQNEPETRERILPPATLPAKKVQVVAYLGVNPTTEKPLLLVSTEVTSVFGEAKCVVGTSTCQLLEMEPTFPETFVFGERGVRYKINVLSVKRVAVQKSPRRARNRAKLQ
jgi:hypothetical protein